MQRWMKALFPIMALALAAETAGAEDWTAQRERMVKQQLVARDITDPEVLRAMRTVPRHEFVRAAERDAAYGDFPLPIGHGQTISQPYIVAYMTQLLRVKPGAKVLEVGTGSGYQAAVLAEVTRTNVYTIEIVQPLALRSVSDFKRLGYRQIVVRQGDGYEGWPEQAPFDAIIVTAAPDHVPQPLVKQLKPGGRLVLPVGGQRDVQSMTVVEKQADGTVRKHEGIPVRFVPLTGKGKDRGGL